MGAKNKCRGEMLGETRVQIGWTWNYRSARRSSYLRLRRPSSWDLLFLSFSLVKVGRKLILLHKVWPNSRIRAVIFVWPNVQEKDREWYKKT